MHPGEIVARGFLDGRWLRVTWSSGRFVSVAPSDLAAPDEIWIAPAIFDPQINGYAGVDFQSDDLDEKDLLHAVSELRRSGCTRFLLTLITDDWPQLVARLERLKRFRDGAPALGHSIAGWHIEGPFLSPEPGFHGAHDPRCMIDPTPALMGRLRECVGSDPLLVTLAPERAGAISSIRAARDRGIVVSLGHTNASADQIQAACEAGATAFTHLGNACPRELDRHDNILWRVLDSPGLVASMIPDSIHVSPAPFRVLHRVLGFDRIAYTTDAMAAAGAPPGTYRFGAMELEVGPDEVVRRPGRTHFAGSALKPIEGVRRAARMLGCSWREVWPGFSSRPASLLGLGGGIAPGEPADFCIVRAAPDGTLGSLRTFCAGEESQ
jgi:N-acetylglucosamine-6-phosphate deacetylase